MLTLPDFQLQEQIYESANSLVFRALRIGDNEPVVLKILKESCSAPEEPFRYGQEYEILAGFDLPGVVRTLGIERDGDRIVIALEDFGGISLKDYLASGPLEADEFLPLAVSVADTLGRIHAADIIHKDLNPANMVINPETRLIKIIDFGNAGRLPRENPVLKNPGRLDGTVAYVSPEQTGRINRGVDYRTDLYSLGVSFYELVTGRLPFEASDAMELVHCHIAKTPTPACEVNPRVPRIIWKIISKLMAKNAEERYRSAFGLKADLERCLELHGQGAGLGDHRFDLGLNDYSGRFQVPQKLYGREKEIHALLEAFERASSGRAEMMLVAGYSGVGKTALVHEVHRLMTEKRGCFTSGKFDQYRKNIPYYAVTRAFNDLCRYLLTEPPEILAGRREEILGAVGNNGRIIIDVIPDLELIIGKQPPVEAVGPTEARNRFNICFLHFVKALCSGDHPLILFIDDLQWVDSASLGLLKRIMADEGMGHLLIVGAYRDNEVDTGHPFIMAVDELIGDGAVINTMTLTGLMPADINRLLEESLFCGEGEAVALTDLIHSKTRGNAFFTHQFLRNIHESRLLAFDFQELRWKWDLERIRAGNITDNVVELMSARIENLPERTSEVLRLAACIGNRFDLSMLSVICREDAGKTLSALWDAVLEGVVEPLDENYKRGDIPEKTRFKFLHDRVQQAAYALIDDDRKKTVHLKIGRLLKENASEEALEENLFDIAGHFNRGRELLTREADRVETAELNLSAGMKAKAATAYEAAARFLNTGIELLPERSWDGCYELSFALHRQCGECEFLLDRVERSEALFRIAVDHAETNREKAEILALQMKHSMAYTRVEEAFDRGRTGLSLCGIDFPEKERMAAAMEAENERLERAVAGGKVSDLIRRPPMTDRTKRVAVRLFSNLALNSYLSGNSGAFTLSALMGMNLTLEHGHFDLSASIYGWYSAVLSTRGRLRESYEFGMLALALTDAYPNPVEKTQAHNIVGTFIVQLHRHIKHSYPVLMKGYHTGLSVGDIMPAVFCYGNLGLQMFAGGSRLPEVIDIHEKIVDISYGNKVHSTGDIGSGYLRLARCLVSDDAGDALGDESFEKDQIARLKASNGMAFILHARLHKAFWFGNFVEAKEIAEQAESILAQVQGYFLSYEHYFLHPLVLAALYADASKEEKEEYLRKITLCGEKLTAWADNSPDNFLHRRLLVRAEKARITGRGMDALEYYDRAARLAEEGGFVQNAALGHELAAKFWRDLGKEAFAGIHMEKALKYYGKWGAGAKVRALEQAYPELLNTREKIAWKRPVSGTPAKPGTPGTPGRLGTTDTTDTTDTPGRLGTTDTTHTPGMLGTSCTPGVSTGSGEGAALDLTSVMKASQTLSGEIVLERLLSNMMGIAMENAGAVRGLLLLPRPEGWFVEAEGHAEKEDVALPGTFVADESKEAPAAIIHYVARTLESVVLLDAASSGNFTRDPYIARHRARSVLGMPLVNRGNLTGILYLENNLTRGAFTRERLAVLNLLSSQMAISIENALLYDNLEQRVEERTVELRREVAERKRAENAAKVASRAKSDFLSSMSHELRTPLNGILGYARILLRERGTDDRQVEGLNVIRKSGEHLLTLINDILDLSKIEARKMELYPNDFHLYALVESVAGIIRMRAMEKGVRFNFESGGTLPGGVRADEKRLRQVLINLLGNAVKFTEQGSVTLRIAGVSETGAFPLVRFEVIDTGVGMTEEQLTRIFLPFEQVGDTRRRGEGTGLGLALSRRLVELMGGKLEVESEAGKGSTFRFEIVLPTVSVGEDERKGEPPPTGYRGKRRTVLIVDDRPENRSILLHMVERVGFRAVRAENGLGAVEKACGSKPDMVIMDLMMPVMDGYAALGKLRELPGFGNTPVIAHSAGVYASDREKSRKAGFDAFLPKPVEEEVLYGLLETHLDLEWVYETEGQATPGNGIAGEGPMVPPPSEEINALLARAMEGDMRGIEKRGMLLERRSPELGPFARKLRGLAKEFRDREILALLMLFKEGGS